MRNLTPQQLATLSPAERMALERTGSVSAVAVAMAEHELRLEACKPLALRIEEERERRFPPSLATIIERERQALHRPLDSREEYEAMMRRIRSESEYLLPR